MDLKEGDRVVCAIPNCDMHKEPWAGSVIEALPNGSLVLIKWDNGPYTVGVATTEDLRRE